MNSLKQFPLGVPYPDSPHAVASSLPTMRDVCGYEEKDPRVLQAMSSGYPRFLVHTYVRKLIDFYLQREGLSGRGAVLVPSRRSAQDLVDFVGGDCISCPVEEAIYLIHYHAGDPEQAKAVGKYVQHVGCGISSRQAEDQLRDYGQLDAVHAEEVYFGSSLHFVESRLAQLCGARPEDVLVASCGMNAFFAAFRAVQEFQQSRERTRWLQLGWVYLDTGCILQGFLHEGETLKCSYNLTDANELIACIEDAGDTLAGVLVECPSNPLVQICDLQRVSDAVRAAGGILIVDPTIASVYNMDVLPFADILVTSLTKYASYMGDVMIGALLLNSNSPYYGDLIMRVSRFYMPPYCRDLSRLAFQMERAPEFVRQMNQNAIRLVDFLKVHPAIRRVFFSSESAAYHQVAKADESTGSVVTIELEGSLERFYDSIAVLKGPSFGTQFTLLSPFMYLAHYDLVTSDEGRALLSSIDLDPELIRISVGAEPYEMIEQIFDAALNASIVSK